MLPTFLTYFQISNTLFISRFQCLISAEKEII